MHPKDPKLTLLVTGGTLDKDYQTTTGALVFSETHLPAMLRQANTTLAIETRVLMLKDSLEMTDLDRDEIAQACQDANTESIVITHGTDTMVDTALALSENANLCNKTIVLTGAMRPFRLGESDACFNLGAALTAAQLAQNGVYIAMNGELFEACRVMKNRQKGVFELTV